MPQIKQSTKAEFDLGTYNNVEVQLDESLSLKRTNLLENSSFEDKCNPLECVLPLATLAYLWYIYKPKSNDIHVSSFDYLSSTHESKSQKIIFTPVDGNELYLMQSIKNISSDTSYVFSCDVKTDNINFQVRLRMQFYGNNNTTYISETKGTYTSTNIFQRITVSGTSPSGVDTIRCLIELHANTIGSIGTLWADSAQLEIGTVATPYVQKYSSASGEYQSSIFYIPDTNIHKLEVTVSIPTRNELRSQIRSASSLSEIYIATWYGPTSNTDYYEDFITSTNNMLSNYSFETPDAFYLTKPDKWYTYNTGTTQIYTYNEPGRVNGVSVAIEYPSIEPDKTAAWIQSVQINNTKQYKLSGWVKGQNIDITSAKMHVDWKASDKSYISSSYIPTYIANPTFDWTYFEGIVTPNSSASSGTIILRLYNTYGKIWFDDISFFEILSPPPTREWSINPIHKNHDYIQYKTLFNTTDLYYSPKLYDIRINYGTSVSNVYDVELSSSTRGISYAYYPGETIELKILAIEHTGISNISLVKMDMYDNNGIFIDSSNMSQSVVISAYKQYFVQSISLPNTTKALGLWKIVITVINTSSQLYSETVFIKVRDDYKVPSSQILLGLESNYGLFQYLTNPQQIIDKFKSCVGIDIWKIGIQWRELEPRRGEYNQQYIDFIIRLMDEAQFNGVKLEIGIAQQWWSEWANDGLWCNGNKYVRTYIYKYLTEAWIYIINQIKNHPALDSYLIIAEDNNLRDTTPENYIKTNSKIISAIRNIDRIHKINIRPNHHNSYYQTIINNNGNHDINYGIHTYPTGAEWWGLEPPQESPLSFTSYFSESIEMRFSPLVHNGVMGIGEIGFYGTDPAKDIEKLIAFERALSMAYDSGYERFMIWNDSFGPTNSALYSQLKAFRDSLYYRSRLTRFNVRVLNDTTESLIQEYIPGGTTYKLDPSKEKYAYLVKYLDEMGYSWYHTTSEAILLQPFTNYDTTINLSDISDKTEAEQNILLETVLSGIFPTGRIKTWNYINPSEPIEIIYPPDNKFETFIKIAGGIIIIIAGISYFLKQKS